MRRIGFYLPRDNYLKVFGPVIDHLVDQYADEFEVVILVAGWRIGKSALQVQADHLEHVWGGRVTVETLPTVDALRKLMCRGAIDAFVNVSPAVLEIAPADVRELRAVSQSPGVKWLALPYVFSQDYQIVRNAASIPEMWDLVCTLGPRSIQYIESELATLPESLASAVRARLVVTGSTELDALARMPAAAALKRKYGLAGDRPVVYVSTAPSLYPLVSSTRTMRGLAARFNGSGAGSMQSMLGRVMSLRYPEIVPYRRYLQALRRFADANGAVLIGKTREKHKDPAFVHDYLDVLFGDRCFYPFTTLELLALSNMYFGFFSASVIEAAGAGIYSVTTLFLPPQEFEPQLSTYRRWSETMLWGAEGFWNQHGVTEVIDGTHRSTYDALDRLADARLEQYAVSRARHGEVMGNFVSYLGGSSQRFVDAVSAIFS